MTVKDEIYNKWIEVRELLVEHEYMKPNGEPVSEDTKAVCMGLRKLMLSEPMEAERLRPGSNLA